MKMYIYIYIYTFFFFKFQRAIGLLRKDQSSADRGTMFANACWTNNSNAKRDAYAEYNRVKEPFNMFLDAYVVSATMKSLGMEKLEDKLDAVPGHFQTSSREVQRTWLHDFIALLVQKYTTLTVQETVPRKCPSGSETIYPCRHTGCERVFKYAQCHETHVKKKHNLVTDETAELRPAITATEDYIFNYGCVYIRPDFFLLPVLQEPPVLELAKSGKKSSNCKCF